MGNLGTRKRKGTKLIPMDDRWREKISISRIFTRLQQGFHGEVDLTPEQIAAAKLILSKVVPDLARTEHTGKDGKDLTLMSDLELEAQIASYCSRLGYAPFVKQPIMLESQTVKEAEYVESPARSSYGNVVAPKND